MTNTNDHDRPTMPTDLPPGEYQVVLKRTPDGDRQWVIYDTNPIAARLEGMATEVEHLVHRLRGLALTKAEYERVCRAREILARNTRDLCTLAAACVRAPKDTEQS